MARYCLDCGETALEGDQFCYYCGEPLPSATSSERTGGQGGDRHCTGCGVTLDSDDNFCYRCGAEQQER